MASVRKIKLTAQHAAMIYQLLNMGSGDKHGNSLAEIRVVSPIMDKIEAAGETVDEGKAIGFKDMVLIVSESEYNFIKGRFEQSGGWQGVARKAILSLEENIKEAVSEEIKKENKEEKAV